MSRSISPLRYGFLDESGDTKPFSSTPLVVTVLITSQPRLIELLVKRSLKKRGTSLKSGELKAAFSKDKVVKELLQALARLEIQIITAALDKQIIVRPPDNWEDLYREVVGAAVRECVKRWPRLELHLDKRYTNKWQHRKLEQFIRERISDLPQEVVLLYQEDSIACKGLQAADFVAWSAGRRYRGNDTFWKIVEGKVKAEIVIRQAKW